MVCLLGLPLAELCKLTNFNIKTLLTDFLANATEPGHTTIHTLLTTNNVKSTNNKQAKESLESCDELLYAKLFNLDATIKKQHMHTMSKTFVFF